MSKVTPQPATENTKVAPETVVERAAPELSQAGIMEMIAAAPRHWLYRSPGDKMLEVGDHNAKLDPAFQELDVDTRSFDTLTEGKIEDLPPLTPATVAEAYQGWIEESRASWLTALGHIEHGLLEGRLSANEVALMRSLLNDPTWFADAETTNDGPLPTVPDFYRCATTISEEINQLYKTGNPIQHVFNLAPIHAPFWQELKDASLDLANSPEKRIAGLERIVRECVRAMDKPESMQEMLCGLANHTALLEGLIGVPLAPIEASTAVVSERTLTRYSANAVADHVMSGAGIYGPQGTGASGGVLKPLLIQTDGGRIRLPDPNKPNELPIIREVLLCYAEELIHAQQNIGEIIGTTRQTAALASGTAPDDELLIKIPEEGFTSELARRYVHDERKMGECSDSDFPNRVSEVDVAGRLLQMATDEGVPLGYLKGLLYERHQDDRAPFVEWLRTKGVSLP